MNYTDPAYTIDLEHLLLVATAPSWNYTALVLQVSRQLDRVLCRVWLYCTEPQKRTNIALS